MQTETYIDLSVLGINPGTDRGEITFAQVEHFHKSYWNSFPLANFEWMVNGIYYELSTNEVPYELLDEMIKNYPDLLILAKYYKQGEYAGIYSTRMKEHWTDQEQIDFFLQSELPFYHKAQQSLSSSSLPKVA